MNSLYGNYRHRKFSDKYPDFQTFHKDYALYQGVGLDPKFQENNTIQVIYYLLASRYSNDIIAPSDENRFAMNLFSIIFQFGPTWEKRLSIQNSLRTLSDTELQQGSKHIINHAMNPGTTPSTDSLEELPGIDDQNTSQYKKSKLDAYANLMGLLEKDVTEEFLSKFKKLFLKFVQPQDELWYITEIE